LRASLKPVDEIDHVWNRPRAPKRMQLLEVANGEMDPTREASLEHERAKTELVVGSQEMIATQRSEGDRANGIDKSSRSPDRFRNREHLRYVAQQACLVCGRKP
jgi:hypothetical protein